MKSPIALFECNYLCSRLVIKYLTKKNLTCCGLAVTCQILSCFFTNQFTAIKGYGLDFVRSSENICKSSRLRSIHIHLFVKTKPSCSPIYHSNVVAQYIEICWHYSQNIELRRVFCKGTTANCLQYYHNFNMSCVFSGIVRWSAGIIVGIEKSERSLKRKSSKNWGRKQNTRRKNVDGSPMPICERFTVSYGRGPWRRTYTIVLFEGDS